MKQFSNRNAGQLRSEELLAHRGFSIIEMMIAVLILTIVIGIIVSGITQLQRLNANQNAQVDITQESREFVDQMTRDIHQAGFPNFRLFSTGFAGANARIAASTPPLANCTGAAVCGLSMIQFEGDLDGTGVIQQVTLTLLPGPTGGCPCILQRSAVPKGNPIASFTQLNNVINSPDNAGGAAPYPIAGATRTGIPYDVFFASYKTTPIFQLVDSLGNPWNSTSLKAPMVKLTVNVLAQDTDQQTGIPSVVSMTAMSKMNN